MDNWSYIDFDILMNSILKGDTSVQEPIVINNNTHSQTNHISFLSHLLKYDNIDRDNLLENLFKIYTNFLNKIEELKRKKIVIEMIKRVNQEWYSDGNLALNNPFSDKYFKDMDNLKINYDNLCVTCQEAILESEKRKKHPIEERIQQEDLYERELNSSVILCKKNISRFNKKIQDTEEILKLFNSFNLPLYIDLSIKHRHLYHQLIDSNEDIPMNIHRIFSNFIVIHNLLFKQLIQYQHTLKGCLKNIEDKLSEIQNRLSNIKIIATYPSEKQEDKKVEIPFNVGELVNYKDKEIVRIIDINKNVPEGEGPIVYIQFDSGNVRDVLIDDLNEINPDEDDFLLDDSDSDSDNDSDINDGLIVNSQNAKDISHKLTSFF